MEKLIKNPFMGRTDGVVYPGRKFDKPADKNIYECLEKDTIKKTGDGEDDFIIEKKVVITKKYSRDDYIQDQSDDVGILNVLKKVSRSGMSLDDHPFAAPGVYTDLTEFPQSAGEAQELIKKAHDGWANIPEDLKAGMDYETFIKTMTPEKILAYYEAKAKPHEEVVKKEGEE